VKLLASPPERRTPEHFKTAVEIKDQLNRNNGKRVQRELNMETVAISLYRTLNGA